MGFEPVSSELRIRVGTGRQSPGLLTVHIEVHDTLGHTVGIGGHAAVGPMVAGPGAHDGDD